MVPQVGPASIIRHPEHARGKVFFRVIRVGELLLLKLRTLGLESFRDIFEENKPEDDVLILGWFKVPSEAIRSLEQLCLKSQIAAVSFTRHAITPLSASFS